MPIKKSDLGPHGEHLLADDNGMVPGEGETLADLTFATHPADAESPVIYESEQHYLAVCATARARAANARIWEVHGGVLVQDESAPAPAVVEPVAIPVVTAGA